MAELSTTLPEGNSAKARNPHYYQSVAHLQEVDIYRVLELFGVTDQIFGHVIKKLLAAGRRTGAKDKAHDVQDAIDSLTRWIEMRKEDLDADVLSRMVGTFKSADALPAVLPTVVYEGTPGGGTLHIPQQLRAD